MSCHIERTSLSADGRGWTATVKGCRWPRWKIYYSGNEVGRSEYFVRVLVERALIKAFQHKNTCLYCIDR